MPYVTKKKGSQYCVFKKGSSSPMKCYNSKSDADKYRDALNINVTSMSGLMAQRTGGQHVSSVELAVIEAMVEAAGELQLSSADTQSAIMALQASPPMLTTVPNVEIVKTGIEYPLSTGPATFTPEDLAEAVAAVDDPAINLPRIWLGHPDDPRIHGKRLPGGPPSGEPAIGKVTGMRLEEQGNLIVGDLEGVPLWLARIMASAYPSRSIEGNFDVETVTGHKWRLVISGLALLGVVWPGVSTLEDIASLFTEDGPDDVDIIEATKERPVTITAAADRTVVGQVTVEDLRRQFYDSLSGDQAWWWIRAIYLDPNELIVDDDDGSLFRVTFDVNGEEVAFSDPKEVKVKYVNASNGGIATETINANRPHVVLFANRAEARPEGDDEPPQSDDELTLDLAAATAQKEDVITINLKEKR